MQAADECGTERGSCRTQKVGFPAWMWRNACVAEFFEWARSRPPARAPSLFGMDCYSLFESKAAVIAFLERHDAEFAAEAKERLHYLDRFESGAEYGEAMVHGALARVSGHIQDVLTKIQARLQWGSDKYECPTPSGSRPSRTARCSFSRRVLPQACLRACGSQASWNVRDQHMTTTLLRIRARLATVAERRAVVWAHNHAGDATATGRGGELRAQRDVEPRPDGARDLRRGRGLIVGQYTYGGRVTAASLGRCGCDDGAGPRSPTR